jgi:hypothetical protein
MSDAAIGRFDPVTGRANGVTVTLTGLSFRQTDKGKRYPYGEFGSEFIGSLHSGLPAPRRRGLLRSTLVCPSCESSLAGIAVGPVPATTEIALKRIPPIRVDLEMPGVRCPGCARALVMIHDRDIASDVSFALMDAFATVGLSPG